LMETGRDEWNKRTLLDCLLDERVGTASLNYKLLGYESVGLGSIILT
jgi:hypothetical protein